MAEDDKQRERLERERARNATNLMSKLGSTKKSGGKPKRVTNADVTKKVMEGLLQGAGVMDLPIDDDIVDKAKTDSDSEGVSSDDTSSVPGASDVSPGEAVVPGSMTDDSSEHAVESEKSVDDDPYGEILTMRRRSRRKRSESSGSSDSSGSDRKPSSGDDVPADVKSALDSAFEVVSEPSKAVTGDTAVDTSVSSTKPLEQVSGLTIESSLPEQDIDDLRGSDEVEMTDSERVSKGLVAWAEALASFQVTVADDADLSRVISDETHKPASVRKVGNRGGRAAMSDKSPVQLRGISRPLFNIVNAEFPGLKNKDALEAYIAKHSGRFDLLEDDEVKAVALKSSAEDGTIAGLANEVAAMRRSLKALRVESSVASLAAIMSDVDVRSDDLSDQLFLRMRELVLISAAYDEAIRQSQGRIPYGFDD